MNTTSINNVIYKIEQMVIEPIPIADCYECTGSAMFHIGIPMPEKIRIKELVIENYRATKPCDLSSFIRFIEVENDKEVTKDLTEPLPHYYQTFLLYANKKFVIDEKELYTGMGYSQNNYLVPEEKSTWISNLDYRFENQNILFSNLKEGSIKMQYWAVLTDEEDLPLLPDDESYLEACMWYNLKQLIYQGYTLKNKDIDLAFIESKWNRKCIQARAEINMPDLHTLQRLSNENLRLLPITSHYYTSFKYLGLQQNNFRHGKYK